MLESIWGVIALFAAYSSVVFSQYNIPLFKSAREVFFGNCTNVQYIMTPCFPLPYKLFGGTLPNGEQVMWLQWGNPFKAS